MRDCITILLFTILIGSLQSQSISVTQIADLPMRTSNNSVVEAFIDGNPYVYSFAGIDESKIYSGIHKRAFRLDVNANEWKEIDPLPDDKGKIACSASRVGDIIYIIGGYHVASDGSETSSANVHRYDIINEVYLPDGTDIPVPIDDQVQIVNGHLIYVITGWSNTANKANVQIYDTVTDSWSEGTGLLNGNSYKAFGASGVIKDQVIYYYGGAQGSGFPARSELRKGVIDDNDPTVIEWSLITPDASEPSYRNAASTFGDYVGWLGGSSVSYNYDGVAYNGSGGVEPANRLYILNPDKDDEWVITEATLPMDLRSVAELNDREKIIVGGMTAGQSVTDEVLLITYEGSSSTEDMAAPQTVIQIFPNPAQDFIQLINEKGDALGRILVFDNQGRLMKEYEPDGSNYSIDIAGWQPGNYVIRLENQDHPFTIAR